MNEELPDGWFTDEDIQLYRQLVLNLSDRGLMAELGVWKGRSMCSIADLVLQKHLTVWAVDTFTGVPHERLPTYLEAEYKDIEQVFVDNVIAFGLYPNRDVVLCRHTTNEAAAIAPDGFDFVFIDADHSYEGVKSDITNWWKKLKPGGVMAGHDFDEIGVCGAVYRMFDGSHETRGRIWCAAKPYLK